MNTSQRMPWFRFYSEVLGDPKLATLTDAQYRVWVNLLCLASMQEERGVIANHTDKLLAVLVARGNRDILTETLTELIDLRIITRDEDGCIAFINFEKRQYDKPSDKPERVAERVNAHRERQRNTDVTLCNAPVTPSNATEEDKDIELDLDTEKDLSNPKVSSSSDTNTPTEAMDASAPSRAQARTKKTTSSKPENVTTLPTERARNPIWDTFVEIFGYAPSTAPERSNWGKCVKNLNEAKATPEDMRVRAARYSAKYGRDRLTPNALVSHWSEFASDAPRGAASPPSQPRAMAANGGSYYRTRAPEPEPYYEPYDAVKHSPWNSTPSEPSPLLARMRKVAPITAESE